MPIRKTGSERQKDKKTKQQKEQPLVHKAVLDKNGVIKKAAKTLPDKRHKVAFLEALEEIETHECYRTGSFPKTKTKILKGTRPSVYRASLVHSSLWRLHFFVNDARQVQLAEILTAQDHDDYYEVVTSRRHRYE